MGKYDKLFSYDFQELVNNYKSFETFCLFEKSKLRFQYASELASLKNFNGNYDDYTNKTGEVFKAFSDGNDTVDAPRDVFTLAGLSVDELDRLWDFSGVVYKFNRGIVLIGPQGKKIEDIFDGTSKHHAMRLHEVSRDEFGVDVPFLGTTSDIQEASIAASQGLVVFLFEGSMCQLYLPNVISNEALEEVIAEVKPRKDFVFYIIRGDRTTNEIGQADVLGYLEEVRKENTNHTISLGIDRETYVRDSYIRQLLRYTEANGMSIYDYYCRVGECHRSKQLGSIPSFEKTNPFLNGQDIRMLLESKDEKIVEYFAGSMSKVIQLNLDARPYLNFDDLTTVSEIGDFETSGDYYLSDVELDTLKNMNGFAVVRDDTKDEVDVYVCDQNEKDVLKGKTTFNAMDYPIESGYYVNFDEFVQDSITDKYPDQEYSFVNEEGEEYDRDTVLENAKEFSKKSGTIRFGEKGGAKSVYHDVPLTEGVYVNKSRLSTFFQKLKMKLLKKLDSHKSL